MSLQNLGKVSSFIKGSIDAIDGMDIDDVVKALTSMNLDKETIWQALWDAGFGVEDIEKANVFLEKMGTSGVKSISKFGTAFKGLGTLIAQNWVAIAAVAAAAVAAITIYQNSFTKLTENAQESKAALEETISEIESLQNQKQSNQDKIAELRKSDSSDNEDEIKALERQNALLEAQIALKEQLEGEQRQEAAEDANKALTKTYQFSTGEMQYVAGEWVSVTESKDILDITGDDISRLDALQNAYNDATDQLSVYNQKREDGIELTKDEEKDFKKLTNQTESYLSQMDNLESNILGNKSTILELYESLLNPDGTIITGFETTANRIIALFPELADGSGVVSVLNENLQSISDAYSKAVGGDSNLTKEFDNWLLGLSETDQDIVYDLYCNTDTAEYSLQKWQEVLAETKAQVEGLSSVPIDISAETSGIESVTSAMSESVSATGLAAETISTLKSRYKGLEDYDPSVLFENTATGVRLNTRELSKLEKQYENLNKQKIADSLANLYDEYDRLTDQIKKYSGVSETAVEDLEAQRDAILDDIESVKILAAEYNGLTSAYNEWVNAQNATQAGSWYDSAKEGLESLKELYKSGDYGNTALQEGLEYFTNADITGIDDWHDRMLAIDAAYNQLDTTITGTTYSINDFMAGGQDGCAAYLEAIQQLNGNWAKFDAETNSWELNYSKFDIASALGTSVEFVEMMQDKLEQYGFDFDTTQATQSAETLEGKILEIQNAIDSFGSESVDIPITIDSPSEQLEHIKNLIDEVNASDVSPEVKDEQLNSLYSMVDRLVRMVNQPAFMEIDVSRVDESLQEPISLLQEYQNAVNHVESLEIKGADTSELDAANAKVSELADQLATLDTTTLSNLGFNLDGIDFDNLAAELEAQIPTLEVPVTITSNSETHETTNDTQTVTVVYERDTTQIDKYVPTVDPVVVTYIRDSSDVDSFNPPNLKRTVTYDIKINGSVPEGGQHGVNGTANVSGTANLNGDWGTAAGGRTLVGELGREIVVDPYTNRWHTVGDNGAEFVNVPHGAIVFNHLQTKSLLSQGRVSGRGKALVSGNAAAMLHTMMYMNDGGGTLKSGSNTTTGGGTLTSGKTSQTKEYSSGSDSSKVTEEAKESVDWIEVALDRIQRAIEKVKTTATSAYKSITTRLSASKDEISLITKEIGIQQSAYNRYMQEANSVGLSSDLANLVQTGAIDISQYDEATRELISDYKDWYSKALNCADAIDELHESLADLYSENFDNVQSDFESRLSQFDHLANSYNADIDMLEAKGYLATTTYYEGLKDVEKQRVAMLQSELISLKKTLADAMASGEIEEGSEAWYDMRAAIDEVEEAIDEANLSLQEYIKTIRQIKWDNFDYGLERISRLTSEADFLIDLLDNKDLFDDKGNLTDEGLAIMGLYGQNYNTYMAQADEYGKEIANVEKQLTEDPGNTDLIDRLETLRDAQWECVQAAEEQKQSMIDLAEEGINAQIDAMDTLIEKYSDLLDSSKDLYEYRKKITGYTDDIKSLKKQLSAYEGDTSEESRATIQKLKVSLEEAEEDLESAEYDHFVSETKKLLSDLGESFESALTERLDDTDALIKDVIGEVNTSASSISETITKAASDVGVTLTQNMSDVWNSDSEDGVLSTYGSDFSSKLTSINTAVQGILTTVSSMISLSGTDLAISELASKGVVNTPAYWQNAVASDNVKWLPELLAKLSENAGSEVVNDFTDPYKAIDYLETNGVINTGDYWKNILKSGELEWLGQLLLNAANHTLPKYATGGLVTATGLAQLDGTANDPELVLNAQDTENFLALKDTLQSLQHQELTKVPSYPEFASFIGSELCDGLLRIAKEGSLIEPVFEGVPLSDKVLKLIELESEHAATMNKLVEDIASIANIAEQINTNDIGITNTFNIAIEHVEDYNDFVTQLQHDKEFERMFSDMLNSATGMGSSFAKYKRSWNR